MSNSIELSKVTSGKVNLQQLNDYDLKEYSFYKLDAKIYFTILKLNDLSEKLNKGNYRDRDYELLQIQYESTYKDLQILNFIYNKVKGV